MDFKQKTFDEEKEAAMKEYECTEDELRQCFRCYKVDHEDAFSTSYGERYCECCYDDMFVSWSK